MLNPYKIVYYIALLLLIASCKDKVTCPAYQSQFLLNKKAVKERFSLFESDSVPKEKIGDVKKSKYGIIVQKPYWKKYNDMKTIPMITVFPDNMDSILMAKYNIPDSIALDSTRNYPIYYSPYLTTFNNDQALYDAMFGDLLPKPRSSMDEIQEDLKIEDKPRAEKKKKKKRFGLFRKKNKDEEPAEGVIQNDEVEPEGNDETDDF
jgi:hypothetical protein